MNIAAAFLGPVLATRKPDKGDKTYTPDPDDLFFAKEPKKDQLLGMFLEGGPAPQSGVRSKSRVAPHEAPPVVVTADDVEDNEEESE